MGAILTMDFAASAQDRDKLPVDAQNARADYLAQRKNGLLTLNLRYLENLTRIQESHTKAGRLEEALAIKAEMDRSCAEVAGVERRFDRHQWSRGEDRCGRGRNPDH